MGCLRRFSALTFAIPGIMGADVHMISAKAAAMMLKSSTVFMVRSVAFCVTADFRAGWGGRLSSTLNVAGI